MFRYPAVLGMGNVDYVCGLLNYVMTLMRKNEAARASASAATIGIVAIGRNEGARLEPCLRSLLTQSRHIVYADSASKDGSAAVARDLGIEVIVLEDHGQLSAAAGRAAGYRVLKSRFPEVALVQFIDGDCMLDPDWISTAESFLTSRPQVAAVCGRRYEAHPEASLYNAMADAEWDTPVGQAQACGGDALYRVAAYDEAGGFRADLLAGEEPELCTRMRDRGGEIWRIDAPMTEHDARMMRFGQWWRRSLRGGYGYAQVWHVTRKTATPIYGRQLASAVLWILALPMAAIAAALILKSPWVLAAIPVAYALHTLRIYRKLHDDRPQRLARAALTFLAKVPETLGAIRFVINAARPTMAART